MFHLIPENISNDKLLLFWANESRNFSINNHYAYKLVEVLFTDLNIEEYRTFMAEAILQVSNKKAMVHSRGVIVPN